MVMWSKIVGDFFSLIV